MILAFLLTSATAATFFQFLEMLQQALHQFPERARQFVFRFVQQDRYAPDMPMVITLAFLAENFSRIG